MMRWRDAVVVAMGLAIVAGIVSAMFGCGPMVQVGPKSLPSAPAARCQLAPLSAAPTPIRIGDAIGPITLDAAMYADLKTAIRALQADDAAVRQAYTEASQCAR